MWLTAFERINQYVGLPNSFLRRSLEGHLKTKHGQLPTLAQSFMDYNSKTLQHRVEIHYDDGGIKQVVITSIDLLVCST